jgi:xanthine dehydrogenase/oxidase
MELTPVLQSIFTKRSLDFYLNGTKIELTDPNPQWTLLDFIRSQHGLKGTKLGCGEGGCGACTVVLQTLDENPARKGYVKHLAINACLFPLIGGECRHT